MQVQHEVAQVALFNAQERDHKKHLSKLKDESSKLLKVANFHNNKKAGYLRKGKALALKFEDIYWSLYSFTVKVLHAITNYIDRVCNLTADKHFDKFSVAIREQREIEDYISEKK